MQSRLTATQLMLISAGTMLGAGWLFSPYYGYQVAGLGVLVSWLIAALLTLVIAMNFAQVTRIYPLIGGVYRLIGITHSSCTATVFMIMGWLTYVVNLPVEAQSITQYLASWLPGLVTDAGGHQVTLTWAGLGVAASIVIGLTVFNTLAVTLIARTNSIVSVWKIVLPLLIAGVVIIGFGSWDRVVDPANRARFTAENVLRAITTNGLAYAFTGFQSGLILAHRARDPERALRLSLYLPVLIGLVLYGSLSLAFLSSLPGGGSGSGGANVLQHASAPLMGLLSLLGLHTLLVVLFADAIIAPLGAANACVAVTARVLYALGRELRPDGLMARLNRHRVPYVALWANAAVGLVFLLPLPTWGQLVTFLSSVAAFAYLAGPVSLLALGRGDPALLPGGRSRPWRVLLGVAGFECCTLLVYWSGAGNLPGLAVALALALGGYVWLHEVPGRRLRTWVHHAYLVVFPAALAVVAWLREHGALDFPWDEWLAGALGLAFCGVFVTHREADAAIHARAAAARKERSAEVAA